MTRVRDHRGRPGRQRGSAYVEALVVTSMLALLWMGAIAFGRLYTLKLATVLEARKDAWLATSGDCGSTREPLRGALAALTRRPDAPRAQALLRAAERTGTRGEARSSVRRARGLLPFVERDHETSVTTTTRFACNEPTHSDADTAHSASARRWISQLLTGARP